jgi:hypothetical protein
MHALAGFEPAFPRCDVSALFTTDKLDPGEQTARLFFPRRNPRLHHLGFKTLLRFQQRNFAGAGNEKPLRSIALEGFENSNRTDRQIVPPPRESARMSSHNPFGLRVATSAVMKRLPLVIVFLAFTPAPIASEGRGV